MTEKCQAENCRYDLAEELNEHSPNLLIAQKPPTRKAIAKSNHPLVRLAWSKRKSLSW